MGLTPPHDSPTTKAPDLALDLRLGDGGCEEGVPGVGEQATLQRQRTNPGQKSARPTPMVQSRLRPPFTNT